MATLRVPIGWTNLDSDVFEDLIGNQIAAATSPSVGDITGIVLDPTPDHGVYGRFKIPQNYVGTPILVIGGVLDGAPGAADTLGFAFRKRAAATNESADGTFDAEQTASATIGSNGSGHADEDWYEEEITLTAGDYTAEDEVFFYVYLDDSGTTYGGNFLLTSLEFQYNDA